MKGFFRMIAAAAAILFLSPALVSCQASKEGVPVSGVSLDRDSVMMNVGDSCTVTSTVLPENASDKSVVWSSSDESVAGVRGGVVKGVSAGTAVVTVTTVDGGKTASCKVTVQNGTYKRVRKIAVSKPWIIQDIGGKDALAVRFTPVGATNKNVIWTSSDESVATVKNGLIIAVAEGSSVITATSEDNPEAVSSCNITVLGASGFPKGITIDRNEAENYCVAYVDFKANPKLRFNVCFHDNGTQLSSHYSEFGTEFNKGCGAPILMTNADFFFVYDNYKYSCDLVMTGGVIKRYPCFEDGKGYYPARSTLGYMEDGSLEIQWARGSRNCSELYKYPEPVRYTSAAEADSDATGREWWWPVEGIGGGPRMVKNGVNVAKKYYDLECCSFNGGTDDSYRTAKTCYGIKADGTLVILVEWYLNIQQAADKLISLGCVDAINFDGGGSSEMLGPRGIKLQAQTDASERYMPSAICISQL